MADNRETAAVTPRNRSAVPDKVSHRRQHTNQTEIPRYTLEQALRVPKALADEYAGKPTKPIHVANAMGIKPASSQFRMLCGAATAYGLTSGGYSAPTVSITPLGQRIIRPLKENDAVMAKRVAFLKPRIMSEFLRSYNGIPILRDSIARNILGDLGVAPDRTQEVLDLIPSSREEARAATNTPFGASQQRATMLL